MLQEEDELLISEEDELLISEDELTDEDTELFIEDELNDELLTDTTELLTEKAELLTDEDKLLDDDKKLLTVEDDELLDSGTLLDELANREELLALELIKLALDTELELAIITKLLDDELRLEKAKLEDERT